MSQTSPLPSAPPPRPEKRLPLGRYLLIAGLGFTLYAWTFGPFGIIRQWNKSRQVTDIHATTDSLRRLNALLLDSIRLYQNDSAVIAAEARRQGLVLPGEISVRFVDTASKAR